MSPPVPSARAPERPSARAPERPSARGGALPPSHCHGGLNPPAKPYGGGQVLRRRPVRPGRPRGARHLLDFCYAVFYALLVIRWRIIHPVGEEQHEPGHAVRQAALAAGWSHRHRDVSGGWLRPTVFGAVDGLVTNASLIAGLGGGGVSAHTVILTGVAALVAGAFSMGTGEYVSVTNQNELVHAEVAVERKMHARFPAAEQAELADTFRGYGADAQTAARMAAAVSRDPDTALRLHTREELGVDPFELPSALLAGISSLIAFSLGALIPLLPYLAGVDSLGWSLGVAALALLGGGAMVGRITGRPAVRAGLRQLLLGGLAVAVTFGVGSMIGGAVG